MAAPAPRKLATPRPLTVKQQKFAALVAAGEPKIKARRAVYKVSDSPDPKHQLAERRRAAMQAGDTVMANEIRRLTWLACPPLEDAIGMRSQAIRVIADLSIGAKNESVRLAAARELLKLAEQLRKAADPAATDREQDRLLEGLRDLYRRIENTAAAAPGLMADAEPAIDITDLQPEKKTSASDTPQAAAPPGEPAAT